MPAAALLIPHAWPALQVRVWHSVSVPGQVAAVRQPTHVPAPSHTEVPPQLVPAMIGGFEGVSPLHTSLVQALPSTGRSVTSGTVKVPPLPLHSRRLQSRGTCAWVTVPPAVLLTPHAPLMQVRVWHSVSVPGQVDAVRQATQWLAPSQTSPVPQAVPDATGRCAGVPAEHSSVVHGLPSTGRSVLLLNETELPAPSHCRPLQSPAVGSVSIVFAALKLKPHTPCAEQVRVWQAVSVPGQSVPVKQPTHWPPALQRFSPPHELLTGSIVCIGAPLVQLSLVHGFRSSWTSLLSATIFTVPSVAHCRLWQSPTVCCASTVPAAASDIPQTPAVHERCTHSVSVPGQSEARLHSPQVWSVRQTPNAQSAPMRQDLPAAHLPQWPPQSMSVSSLFLMWSEQVGAATSAPASPAPSRPSVASRAPSPAPSRAASDAPPSPPASARSAVASPPPVSARRSGPRSTAPSARGASCASGGGGGVLEPPPQP